MRHVLRPLLPLSHPSRVLIRVFRNKAAPKCPKSALQNKTKNSFEKCYCFRFMIMDVSSARDVDSGERRAPQNYRRSGNVHLRSKLRILSPEKCLDTSLRPGRKEMRQAAAFSLSQRSEALRSRKVARSRIRRNPSHRRRRLSGSQPEKCVRTSRAG
jgi:hypothetical protein